MLKRNWFRCKIYTMLCRRILTILIVVYVPIVTCLEPDFLYAMENVTVSQGRDAKFTCVVNNLGGYGVSPSSSAGGDHGVNPRVAWIKADTKAVLAIHLAVITNNARLSVSHGDTQTWSLLIKDARPEDRGVYMCQVNTNPMKSQSAHLEVVIPPDIINEETSGDVMVPEGGSAKLVCKARGYPKPEINWRREDGFDIIIRTENNSKSKVHVAVGEILSFQNIGRNEMGSYLCIASNGVPPSVSKRMLMQVHFRPLIEVTNQLVGAPTGTDVTLACRVEASPKPINYWTRETGEMIISNDKYTMNDEPINTYSAAMYLTIKNLQSGDFGGYKCISKNSLGDAESSIRLYEISRTDGGHKNYDSDEDDSDLNNNRLNHAYQGSLRETASTSQPRRNAPGEQSSRSSGSYLHVKWTIANQLVYYVIPTMLLQRV